MARQGVGRADHLGLPGQVGSPALRRNGKRPERKSPIGAPT